jgi:hypothetical protein
MASGLLLRVDEVIIDHDLEGAAPRGDEREVADVVLELL